jgi:hypothetical protein
MQQGNRRGTSWRTWGSVLASAAGVLGCDASRAATDAGPDVALTGTYVDLAQAPVADCDRVHLQVSVRVPTPVTGLPASAFNYSLALQAPDGGVPMWQSVPNTCFAEPAPALNPGVYDVCITGLQTGASYVLRVGVTVDGGTIAPGIFFMAAAACLDGGVDGM